MNRFLQKRPSQIGTRLFAFNLLVVFVPVIGVLYLDVYESRLLQAQEREMVQQARLLSAVLGDAPQIDTGFVQRAFARLERRTEARLQVFDAAGSLIADSRDAPAPAPPEKSDYQTISRSAAPAVRDRALYKLGAWMANIRDEVGRRARCMVRPAGRPARRSRTAEPGTRAGAPRTLWCRDQTHPGTALVDDGECAAGAA